MAVTPNTIVRGTLVLALAAALMLVAAVLASTARADDPPLGTVVVSPGGSQNATGGVQQGGQATACVNGQRSAADPDSPNAAQVNSGPCATSGSSQGGGSSGTASSTGASGSTTTASTSAAGARGLRIARLQYFTNGVTLTKRLRVLVTVRDLSGRRVRNAIVSIGPLAGARHTVGSTNATFTNRLGQAGLVLRARTPMLGQRVLLKIGARTPQARVTRVGSVLLPRALAR